MRRAVECVGVERSKAEAVYEQGRDAVVLVLLALSVQNERLAARVEALTARVTRQDERIATLERQLGRSSRNSSQPPSADPPAAAPHGAGRTLLLASKALSPAMRATGDRFCRPGQWMR